MEALDPKYRRSIGAALVLAGILVNPWVIGRLFAPDGVVNGEHRILTIAFVELACLFTGVALLWAAQGGLRLRRHAWITIGAPLGLAALVTATGWGIWAYNSAHHHTTNVTGAPEPTAAERAWADQFVTTAFESARRHGWLDFDKARADGFEPQWNDREHFVNRAFLFDDAILDPERPEFLMYQDTPRGKLLVGFMFYGRTIDERGPLPGGSLATWHFHPWGPRGYCAERSLLVVSRPDDQGQCAGGTWVDRSGEMLHVWFVDHPLGPFADAMVFPEVDSGLDIAHLHPMAVHFTIALVVVTLLFDMLGWLMKREGLHSVAFANLVVAGVSAIATVALGMAAEVTLLIRHDVHAVLDTHKLLGFVGAGGIVVLMAWRALGRGRFPARAGVAYLLCGAVTAGAVVAAGYVGGQLVYQHGVAVRAIDRAALERLERTVYGGQRPVSSGTAPSHAGH